MHIQFPYPWVLTTLHSTSTTTGCLFLLSTGHFSLTHLTSREHTTLLLFSTLFTLNIAASSLSLSIISLALHQALRSTGPIATVLIQWLLYGKRYDRHVYLSLFGMSVGIVLATAGDYECTLAGFLVTMLGVLLATLKVRWDSTCPKHVTQSGHLRRGAVVPQNTILVVQHGRLSSFC